MTEMISDNVIDRRSSGMTMRRSRDQCRAA